MERPLRGLDSSNRPLDAVADWPMLTVCELGYFDQLPRSGFFCHRSALRVEGRIAPPQAQGREQRLRQIGPLNQAQPSHLSGSMRRLGISRNRQDDRVR